MFFSASSCKVRWNNIRDNYRKSLKKRVTNSGQAASKITKYKYDDQMSFLVNFIKERKTVSNINCEDEEVNAQDDGDEDNIPETLPNDNIDSDVNLKHKKPIAVAKRKINVQHKRSKTLESAVSTLMKFVLEKNEREKKEKETCTA